MPISSSVSRTRRRIQIENLSKHMHAHKQNQNGHAIDAHIHTPSQNDSLTLKPKFLAGFFFDFRHIHCSFR